ncbi:hypothetical protein LCGC14_1570670 [marine sediment metagenome]|uniref:Uncharacterized protein n=1 Tax=marine sediment metagenome TaxID=412755 RepID=A0A0F9LK55_9ZZZZ
MSFQSWQETLITSQGDGATITAAAATSMLPAAAVYTLPANFFDVIGKQVMIKASGRITSVITTPGTARYDVRLGGGVVFDGLATLLDTVAGHTTVAWDLEILLTCRVIGATANLFGIGKWASEDLLGVPATAPKGVLTAMLPWDTTPAVGSNFDSTTSQTVDVQFTQTAATGSMTCHQYSLISMN